MKKTILIAALIFAVGAMNAMKLQSGSLVELKSQEIINFECNFDNCRVDKHSMEWAMTRYDNWDKGVGEVIDRFKEGVLEKSDYIIGSYPDAKYTIIYHIATIDDDQDSKGIFQVIETASGREIAVVTEVNGDAGKFGSFFNLLGDAFEDLGKKFAKFLKKQK